MLKESTTATPAFATPARAAVFLLALILAGSVFALALLVAPGLNVTALYGLSLGLLWWRTAPHLQLAGLGVISLLALGSVALRGLDFAEIATTLSILLTFWILQGILWTKQRQARLLRQDLQTLKSSFKSLKRRERNASLQANLALAAHSDLLTSLSHELRTPLNAILGFAEIIQQERFGRLGNERYRSYVGHIADSGNHLLGLIDRLLDVCDLETGKVDIQESLLDPEKIIADSLAALAPEMQAKGITAVADMTNSPYLLLADEAKFRQILDNLLSNAVAFTGDGGKVLIRAWCHARDGYVVQVSDTGVGIRLQEVCAAIRPFGLVNGTRSELARSGLGLTISKSLVELHAGSMDVQSRQGGGTCVTLRFPAERTAPAIEGGSSEIGAAATA